mmetsp:Transcript_4888/g.19531  ORF Transcript_4888/g.19531 Transcript_4888/m.19531 type:complete len:210 (-) Transcript_4888:1101-1730(-)
MRCANTTTTTNRRNIACKARTSMPFGVVLVVEMSRASDTAEKPREASGSSSQPLRPSNSKRNVSENTPTATWAAHVISTTRTRAPHLLCTLLHSRERPLLAPTTASGTLPSLPVSSRLTPIAWRCKASIRCPASRDDTVAPMKVNMPACGTTTTSMASKLEGGIVDSSGVCKCKRKATMKRHIMNESMSDHFPSASSAMSKRSRLNADM